MTLQSHSWAYIQRKTPMFTAELFTIAKTWKQPKCPSTGEWIKKMWNIYTREYYSAIKKNEIMPFATIWRDLGVPYWVKSVRKRRGNIIWHPLHVETKKKWSPELTKQKGTHRLRQWTYGCRGKGWLGTCGMVMYTSLYLKGITNKDLLYSTCSVVRAGLHARQVWERMEACICAWVPFTETTTTVFTDYTLTQNKKFKVRETTTTKRKQGSYS